MQWRRTVRRRVRGQEYRPWQRRTVRRAHARQPVCQQGAETVAEEHMWLVKVGSQLIVHLVDELPQGGEALPVGDLDRNHLDGWAQRLGPGLECQPATAGMVKAKQSHGLWPF